MECEWIAGAALVATLIVSLVLRRQFDAMGSGEGIFAFLFLGFGMGILGFLIYMAYIVITAFRQ